MSLPRISIEDLEPVAYKTMKEATEISKLSDIYEYLSYSTTALIAIIVFFGFLISILLFKTRTNKNNFNCGTLIINDEFKARDVFKAKKGKPVISKSWMNDGESWMNDRMLTVEVYMTEEQIGCLVKDYMVKTNGMPLQVVFPEYDM